MDLNLANIPSGSTPQNFVNHLTPETFMNTETTTEGQAGNATETPVKRRPGRPKGSGKKDSNSTPNSANMAKRPVGRPRKDGLPAGSAGPSRAKKNNSADGSEIPSLSPSGIHTHYSETTPHLNGTRTTKNTSRTGFSFDNDWAELVRTKPTIFLTTLLVALAGLPSLPSTSALSVEEAFKSHLNSLASPTQTHHIPSLYSILKTFWLPSSPAYFALTASTSTARTPSDHRFLYWDPQPLVFNGIYCPSCSSPLINQGRIKSGPIKVYDIERPFFIIGCEYICRSPTCTNSATGEARKYASTDPSILRSLPTKLKDEFPARLISENDTGTGADIWNWRALGVSKLLWNLVRGALKAGLQKEGIIDILYNVQRGLPGDDDKKGDDHEESSPPGPMTNGNGQQNGSYLRTVQQFSGGFPDAYNNAWKANTAAVESGDGNVAPSEISSPNTSILTPPVSSTAGPSTQPQPPNPVYNQPQTYSPSVYPHTSAPNFTSYQYSSQHHEFSSATSSPRIRPTAGSINPSSTPNTISSMIPNTMVSPTSAGPGTPTPPVTTISDVTTTLNGGPSHSTHPAHTSHSSHPTHTPHLSHSQPVQHPSHPHPAPHPSHPSHSQPAPHPSHPHTPRQSHASTPAITIRPTSTELGKRTYPFAHSEAEQQQQYRPPPPPPQATPAQVPPNNQMTVLSPDNPRKRSPRHCSKCGSPDCKGKGGRNFCMNPCKDCGKLECRGRNSRRPDKSCSEGWPEHQQHR